MPVWIRYNTTLIIVLYNHCVLFIAKKNYFKLHRMAKLKSDQSNDFDSNPPYQLNVCVKSLKRLIIQQFDFFIVWLQMPKFSQIEWKKNLINNY